MDKVCINEYLSNLLRIGYNKKFVDPMEDLFKKIYGVSTFEFVHHLYSYSGCQWELDNAYAYLQYLIDTIYYNLKVEYEKLIVEINPFESPTDELSLRLAVRESAVG